MEIAFLDKALRHLCENAAAAERDLGEAVSSALKRRIADICACDTINDLPASKPYPLDGHHQGEMAIHLDDGVELVFCANHHKPPLLITGEINWQLVSRIMILRIGK